MLRLECGIPQLDFVAAQIGHNLTGEPVGDQLGVAACGECIVEHRRRNRFVADQIRGPQVQPRLEITPAPCRRQLRQGRKHGVSPRVVDNDRNEVGLLEVPVILRLLFGAHRYRDAAVLTPVPGFLNDHAAALEHFCLALDLIRNGAVNRTQRVHVLHLGSDPQLSGPRAAHGNVDVKAHASFLQASMGDTEGPDNALQLNGVGPGLIGRANVGFADDLDKWYSRAVEIEQRERRVLNAAVGGQVPALAGVLFHVNPGYPDRAGLAVDGEIE